MEIFFFSRTKRLLQSNKSSTNGTVRAFTFPDSRLPPFARETVTARRSVAWKCHYDCPHVAASVRPNATTCRAAPVQLRSDTHIRTCREHRGADWIKVEMYSDVAILRRFNRRPKHTDNLSIRKPAVRKYVCKEYTSALLSQRNPTWQLYREGNPFWREKVS